MSTEQYKAMARDFIDAIAAGDVERIAAAYHDEGGCWTSGNTLISGFMPKDKIVEGAGAVLAAFPEGLTFEITGITAEGERVAIEAESDGVHVSGQHYHNYYHFLCEFKDGKLYRFKEYMDTEMVTDILCGGQRPPGH